MNNYTYNTILLPRPQNAKAPALKSNIFDETLHYADAAAAGTPRFDGKISVRNCDNALTAYAYDCHGRLITSTSYSYRGGAASADFSTEYTYDRNANLCSVTRYGVTDIVRGVRSYGIHNDITMTYSVNRLKSATVEAAGADYEGRTGLPQFQSSGTDFSYDSNGNMTSDAVRGIVEISYNRLNLPERMTFADGHRQTIAYDGFGRKTRVDYAQGPKTVFGGDLPADGDYGLTSSRVYVGPHVFTDGQLEYSAFDGGYFNADCSPCYYITDWQGNNAAVVNSAGSVIQSVAYYPYGEPTVEPKGQRYLFGGKEREHAGGRNAYDFGPRSLLPYGCWPSPDILAEKSYPTSPFVYCGGDPINNIDISGLETLALSNDSIIQTYAANRADDPTKLVIYSHGNYGLIEINGVKVNNAQDFINVIKTVSKDFKDIETQKVSELILKACRTGSDDTEEKPNFARSISKSLYNTIVTAPNGRVETNYTIKNGTIINLWERVIDKNNNTIPSSEAMNTYFRGHKIDPSLIPIIKAILGIVKLQSKKTTPQPLLINITPPSL